MSATSADAAGDDASMVARLTARFALQPHPEGGFYGETYRAPAAVTPVAGGAGATRAASTAIYFLITPGSVSRLHRIKSDEVWHFYLGGPMTVLELDPAGGGMRKTVLGQDVLAGQAVQHVVRAGTWFGSYPNDGSAFSFVGCTVAPGFEFEDFELASRQILTARFPAHAEEIARLTEGLP
jgi:predicted cupin superfamily sugar epimerase